MNSLLAYGRVGLGSLGTNSDAGSGPSITTRPVARDSGLPSGLRLPACLLIAAIILVASACGGSTPASPAAVSPAPSSRVEFATCSSGGDIVQIVNHGDGLEKFGQPIPEAVTLAIDHAAENYGWEPVDPVCIHVFRKPDDFVEGLQVLGGLSETTAESNRRFWGMVIWVVGGADAMYINVGMINVPELVARTAVHEYFHIVQDHLGGTVGPLGRSFPTWFLEGMAYWEMNKLLGNRYPNWFVMLQEDVRNGRDTPLSSLVTWEESLGPARQTPKGANPLSIDSKVQAAFMFLEELAGPTAAAQILRGNNGGTLATFAVVFQQVSGLTPEEFETRLREFIVREAHTGS